MAQRKIPGNLTFDDLREMWGGYAPPTKIHLQELLPGGKAGFLFRELTHWQSVSISRQLSGKGRATISLANSDDRHFDNSADRVYNPNKDAISKAYLRDLHRRVLGYVREINPNRRGGNTLDFQGLQTFNANDVEGYVKFLYNFDGIDGGKKNQVGGGKPDFPALGLFQRVIVDAQGPDGAWYALFTGVVSSIEDRMTAGDTPVIDVVCSDYWRLFDLSEIVVRTGVDPIIDNIQLATIGPQPLPETNSLADKGGAQVLQIIMDIVQRTMAWIPYAASKTNTALPLGPSGQWPLFPDQTFSEGFSAPGNPIIHTANSSRQSFFNDDPFWRIPTDNSRPAQGQTAGPAITDVPATYEGHDNLRHYAKAPTYAGPAQDKKDGDEPTDGMPVGQLYATLLVDKYIADPRILQATPYLTFIQAFLQPWQTNRTLGSTVIRRVAEASFYDIFLTPNGDVVYQIPKYNNCPGEYKARGASSSGTPNVPTPAVVTPPSPNAPLGVNSSTGNPTFASNPGQTIVNGVVVADTSPQSPAQAVATQNASFPQTDASNSSSGSVVPPSDTPAAPPVGSQTTNTGTIVDIGFDGDYDYAPQPENYAQKNHGFNYALTSLGMRGWRLSSSEEGLVTTVRMPFGPELINFGQTLTTGLLTGRTPLEETRELIARFGLRVFEAQQMTVKALSDPGSLQQQIRDTFAMALLQQINGRSFGGSIDASIRMDLDVGKNIFHIERQRLFYIVGVSHTIRQGQDAQTTLQLGWGHDISREIISPLASNRNANVTPAGGTASASAGTSSGGAQTATPGQVSGASIPVSAAVSGGTLGFNVFVGNATQSFSDNAANDIVVPTTFTDPFIASITPAYNKTSSSRLTNTTQIGTGVIVQGKEIKFINVDPDALLQQANVTVKAKYGADASITLAEYTLARFLASEGGGVLEQVLIAQALKNAANELYRGSFPALALTTSKGQTKLRPITNGFYGGQCGKWAATSLDPTFKNLLIAQAVIRNSAVSIIPGIMQFFNVRALKTQPGVTKTKEEIVNSWAIGPRGNIWTGKIAGLGSSATMFLRRKRPTDTPTIVAKTTQKALAYANTF